MRRGGRPGLIGLAARTAVVTGTANAMSNRAATRRAESEQQQAYQQQAYQQQQASQQQQQQAPPPAPAAAPAGGFIEELTQLASLHSQGLLNDDEFAAAKAKLLSS